jgi:hypothetical protein
MARVRIVEILDARGHVRSRVRIAAFPASIGRGFDNDVIIDDPYVSPRHLRLVEDEAGVLWVEDAGSKNGTRRAGRAAPEPRFAIVSGGSVVLGRTTVRIFDAEHSVPDAAPDHRDHKSLAEVFGHSRTIAIAAGAFALAFVVRGYLDSSSRDVAENVVTMLLGVLLLTAVWAGIWALIGRMTHVSARFRAHFAWACVGAVVLTSASVLLGWIEFAIPSSDALATLFDILLASLFAVYLAGHVTMASSLVPRQALRRTAIGLGVASVVAALVTLTAREQFSATPDYSAALAPVPSALLQKEGIDDFAAEALKLQKEVDKLASKRERASLIPNPMKAR